jgi:hypothetical protein
MSSPGVYISRSDLGREVMMSRSHYGVCESIDGMSTAREWTRRFLIKY